MRTMRTMRATRWLRAAAALLFLSFLGHTAAVVLPAKSSGPREDAVLQSMKDFHFDAMGRDRTIWDFWLGFNVFTSVALAILVVLTWQLGGLARKDRALAAPLVAPPRIGPCIAPRGLAMPLTAGKSCCHKRRVNWWCRICRRRGAINVTALSETNYRPPSTI